MFERFTAGGRRALVLMQEQARALNHSSLEREHLLLALLEQSAAHPDSVCALIFADGGAPPDELAALITASAERRTAELGTSKKSRTESPPFSAASKKILELALREALQLGHNYVAEFHMLLAMIRAGEQEADSEWSTLIQNAGLTSERAREIAGSTPQVAVGIAQTIRTRLDRAMRGEKGTPGLEAVLRRAAKRNPEKPTTTGDLLLAMLDEPDTHARVTLKFLKVPARKRFEEFLNELAVAGALDGAAPPKATVDKKTGAITIRDPRITALMSTPPDQQSQEDHDRLDELIKEALAEAREVREPPKEADE